MEPLVVPSQALQHGYKLACIWWKKELSLLILDYFMLHSMMDAKESDESFTVFCHSWKMRYLYIKIASYDKLYFPNQIMWEHSLIFWNSASSWLTHTVFPLIWTPSSFIIKVCAILKQVLLCFHVLNLSMQQMNQWLYQTHNYNWFLFYWSSLQFCSSMSRWIKVQPFHLYNLHSWISSKRAHHLLLTKMWCWCDQILVNKLFFDQRMAFISDQKLV